LTWNITTTATAAAIVRIWCMCLISRWILVSF